MELKSGTDAPILRNVVDAGFVIYRWNMSHDRVEYLILQSSGERHAWVPPKGDVVDGDNVEEAAWNELEKKTGLIKSSINIMNDFKHEFKYTKAVKKCKDGTDYSEEKRLTVHLFLAELIEPNHQIKMSTKHQNYNWLPLDDAKGLLKTIGGSDQYIDCFEKCEQKIQKQNG